MSITEENFTGIVYYPRTIMLTLPNGLDNLGEQLIPLENKRQHGETLRSNFAGYAKRTSVSILSCWFLSTNLVEKLVFDYLGHKAVDCLNGRLRAEIQMKKKGLIQKNLHRHLLNMDNGHFSLLGWGFVHTNAFLFSKTHTFCWSSSQTIENGDVCW